MEERVEKQAVKILSAPVYQGFGPTLAAEYLEKKHGIEASKETVRQWMRNARRRDPREAVGCEERKVKQVHGWRPRRDRLGELVQWDTSEHGWLEGRGERLYLIAMIDDATSRLFARFVRHDSSEENTLACVPHAAAVELLEEVRTAGDFLYRQGQSFSDGREAQAG
jgi:hypothetical protein